MDTDQYDLVLSDSSTTIGVMLVKGDGNAVMEQSVDAEVLPPRVLTAGEFTNAEFPPTIRVTVKQDDWRWGLGGQLYSKTPLAYNTSTGIDASVDKIIKLPPDLQATTYDTVNTGGNGPGGYIESGGNRLWHFADISSAGNEILPYLWDFTNRLWAAQTPIDNDTGGWCGEGVVYGGNTYVPVEPSAADGAPGDYIFQAVGAAGWTVCTLATRKFKFLTIADNRLWGAYQGTNKNQIYSSLDGTNATGSWAGPTSVGSSSYVINAIVPWGANRDILLIIKEEGIYTLDTPGNVLLLYDLSSQRHDNNGRGAKNWNGRVLIPMGTSGMLELLPDGSVRDISFRLVAPDVTKLDGRVIALGCTTSAVYCIVEESTSAYLLKAEWRDIEGGADYRWHLLQTFTISASGSFTYRQLLFPYSAVSGSDTYRRLWLSRDGTITNRPQFLPFDSVDRDFAYEDASTLSLDTVDWDANLPQVTKLFIDGMFTTKNLSSGAGGHTIPVQYSVDGGTTWANLGSSYTLNTSPTQTLTFPAGTTGTKVRLRFKHLRGTTTTTSPEIHDFTINAAYRPAVKKIVTYRMDMKNGLRNLTGMAITNMPTAISQLRTWNNTTAGITVKDRFSQSGRTMITRPGSMKEFAGSRRYNARDDYIVEMSFLEV